ncbi:MAG: DinB family protein [Bacteroidota bacterium]
MKVNFLQLLQESNQIDECLEKEVMLLSDEDLRLRPDDKSWSVIEVIDHLNLTFDLYKPRLDQAFSGAEERIEVREEVSLRATRSLMIQSVAPKGNKRPFKMKTFDFFNPEVSDAEVEKVLAQYKKYRVIFNQYLKDARTRDVDLRVVPSAIKQISFRVPEALKFLLSHEQRHIVQLREIIAVLPEHA